MLTQADPEHVKPASLTSQSCVMRTFIMAGSSRKWCFILNERDVIGGGMAPGQVLIFKVFSRES